MILRMNNFKQLLIFTAALILAGSGTFAQPLSRISIDFRAGLPTILTAPANPNAAPFGGFGVRYSFNEFVALSLDVNGGVLAGRTQNGFFRNNFIQYGGKVHFNPTAFIKDRPKAIKRFNAYLSLGFNNMNYYYTLQQTSIENKLSRIVFNYDFGLALRYYANEMVDFIGGTNFHFTETQGLDNFRNGKYDHFALSYLGLSVKILPYERKQHPDWAHIDITNLTETQKLIVALDKKIDAENVRTADSLASLRKSIQKVDGKVNTTTTKVDTVDAKLNLVIDMLTKMQSQAVAPPAPATPAPKNVKGQKPAKGSQKTTPPVTEPAKSTPKDTSSAVDPALMRGGNTPPTPPGAPAKILDQSKVKESYAIVVGSFQQEENAVKVRDKYAAKGWNAHILGNARSTYKRIVIFSNNYYEAVKIVTELRNTESPDVWMLDIATGKGVFIK
jgi:cell division protein FtsN